MDKNKPTKKEKSKKSKALKIIGNILFFTLIGFMVTYYVWNFIDIKNDYKYPTFGMRSSVIVSPSMSSVNDANTYITSEMQQIQKYDVVTTINYQSYDEIQLYDIATYFDGKELICHRVIDKYVSNGIEYVVFRGDANNVSDVPVSYDLIRGKVINITPQVGHVVAFIQSPYVFIALFGTIFFVALGIFIVDRSKEKKKAKSQTSEETKQEGVESEEQSVTKDQEQVVNEPVAEPVVEEQPTQEVEQPVEQLEEPVQEEPQKEKPLPVEETPVEETPVEEIPAEQSNEEPQVEETPNEQQEQEVPEEENKEVEETKPEPKPQKKAKKAAPKPTPKPETPVEKEEKKPVNFRTYHVSKRADGKWQVKYAGGSKAIKLFNTQKEAMEYTKVMAENQGGSVLLHNSKGANKGRIKKK